MKKIKNIFKDKGSLGVAIVCLLMLSLAIVSNMTGKTFAASTMCLQCNNNSNVVKVGTSINPDDKCSVTYKEVDFSVCENLGLESSKKSLIVNFKLNGGDSLSGSSTKSCEITTNNSCSVAGLPTASRTGYNFKGWGVSSSCTAGVTERITLYASTDNYTTNYYACWTKKTYTVTFDANGGSGTTMSTKSVTYGGTYGELPRAYRTGYNFLGWYTAASGGSKVTSSSTLAKQGDHTLYAHWEIARYTLTCEKNDGSGEVWTKGVYYGDVYGGLPKPMRTGYTFLGWYTASSGGTKVTEDTIVTKTSNHTLYAHWTTQTITINFVRNSDGDEVGGFQEKKTVAVNGTYGALPILTRFGYNFEGWFTSSTGGEEVTGTSKLVKDEDHYLYAHWKLKMVTVHFVRNSDGDDVEGFQGKKTVAGNGTYGALPILKRNGYNFEGWFTSATGGTEVTGTSKLQKDEDHYLYAHWTEDNSTGSNPDDDNEGNIDNGNTDETTINYNVKYNANGGRGTMENSSHTYGVSSKLRKNIFTRIGYTFNGWNTKANGSGKFYKDEQSVSDLAKTDGTTVNLYAQWKENTYTVKYDANGGTGTMSDSIYTYGIFRSLSANTFVRDGYTFKYWNTKADGTGVNYTNSQSISIAENMTLYAQWKSNSTIDDEDEEETKVTYYIKYNANGGKGTMENSSHIYGFASNLNLNKFTREGYIFNGWNTKADGTGDSYTDGQTISNLSSTNGDIINLYAMWTAIEKNDVGDENDEGSPGNDGKTEGGSNNGDASGNKGDKNDNIDKSPQTGSLATILVSLIGLGSLCGFIYYRKKIKI